MQLPPYLISVNIFLCERVLTESDGVVTSVRLIDIFYVADVPPHLPEGSFPVVQAYGCALIRSVPGNHGEHSLQFKVINTVGEINALGEPWKVLIESRIENAPGGATITAQLNVIAKRFGTCYLCLYFDEQEVARAPFTILSLPKPVAETKG